jgi:hypothetical protein
MSFWIDILLIVLLVGVSVILILQRRQLNQVEQKQQRLEHQLHILEEERPALAQMARLKGDDETFQLIRNRYDLVAELLAARVSDDAERTDTMLEHVDQLVADPAEFMRQLRLIFARMQPLMMERFRESGLTDREVEICCLYALGLNGKTIQQYTRDGRHFQNVSLIRKKLGLGEHDKNIDGFIRSLQR